MRVVCGCCETVPATPREVFNRPALSKIEYRVGSYASFRQAMLEAISAQPELAALTTRRSDDYAVTILELWAALADILTFYQERYANEAFLRTASFRDSIARLAALLDYRLRPGVAAETWIAFQIESNRVLTIPVGQKVQSVPERGGFPQTFETIEEIVADSRWNRLRVFPSWTERNVLEAGQTSATLDRLEGPKMAASLAPHQSVAIFNDGLTNGVEEKEIKSVTVHDDRIMLTWTQPIQGITWTNLSPLPPLFPSNVIRFRRKFRVFGHNAPENVMKARDDSGRIVWDFLSADFDIRGGSSIDLDGVYENLFVGQRLLVASPTNGVKLVTITAIEQEVAHVPASGSPASVMSALVTHIQMSPSHLGGDRREIAVYELEGEDLLFWDSIYDDPLTTGKKLFLPGIAVHDDQHGMGVEVGRTIERNAFKPGLSLFPVEIEQGRRLLIQESSDQSEPLLATVKAPPIIKPPGAVAGEFCHLVFEVDVARDLELDSESAYLLGNIARASHGETERNQVLGSGDASASFLRFVLAKKPLTYLSAPTSDGAESTLHVLVNRVLWKEVPGLFGQPADAPIYELRHTDDGTTIVQFGDGVMGALTPSGQGNIQANYRVGSGLSGRVGPRTLTTLLAKPVGVIEATNPLGTEGGADPETLDTARANAPRTVRTFGRAVSLRDYEDLITTSGEVTKAHATWIHHGLDRVIHLTIAGGKGAKFSDEACQDFARMLDAARDRNQRLLIDNFITVFVQLKAGIVVNERYDEREVLAAAKAAVFDYLSFERQTLGQSLFLSNFYSLLQATEGVVYVDIDEFQFKSPAGISLSDFLDERNATTGLVQSRLRVFSARRDPTNGIKILPSELAALESPRDVTITLRV